jgi:hypothetical protein
MINIIERYLALANVLFTSVLPMWVEVMMFP